MILKNGEIYVIEVNPRLQGTYEAAEACFGILTWDKPILMACQGDIDEHTLTQKFCYQNDSFCKKTILSWES